MMGQKVIENMKDRLYHQNQDQTNYQDSKVTTAPDMIFRDFVPKFDQQYEMGTATNNAGLTSDRRIFNKKKCFVFMQIQKI